ncbi:hypothetical protein SPOG_00888 [Schizosaccharomyces cryophilus OY26]|uniref:Uncharacterized protein n=1 Tax=Schizosaccharomyces cryophilus (strain OY26 / ATCC MYA-4695 / CBS 11777 / NBRC 106824 / NRRL Y48691) TaxID=653667 RepID=S9VVJ2_SCHCR|nr:uncharacterized protein SPOG_00888 [Schizosaccharomyces cryophilus OY26]EPY50125.1 hypothetical protein SPOG_00888 [Schizosaccharomyces cryophilus OY26]
MSNPFNYSVHEKTTLTIDKPHPKHSTHPFLTFNYSESLEQPSYISRSYSVYSEVQYVTAKRVFLDDWNKRHFWFYQNVIELGKDEGSIPSNVLGTRSSKVNSRVSLVKQFLNNYRLLQKHMRDYFTDSVPRTYKLGFLLELYKCP